MRQFLKFTFASVIGTTIAILSLILILFVVIASTATQPSVDKEGLLHLKLDYAIPELTDNVETQPFTTQKQVVIGLHDLDKQIRYAANDEKVTGLYLNTQSVSMNPTSAYILVDAIEEFKESEKPVYAYGHYFTQSGYILASVADSLFMNPNGLVDLRGYGSASPYFAGMSEKTGIDFEVYHAGKYKSAVEPYYRSESSPENRYQSKIFLGSFHQALVDHIAQYRNLDSKEVDRIVRNALSTNASSTLSLGLIDKKLYEYEFKERVAKHFGWDAIQLITPELYQTRVTSNNESGNAIAVVYAEGVVAGMEGSKGSITMKTYDEVFDKLEQDRKLKAIVLRINSPGGSVWTSDNFLSRVKQLQAKGIQVVASFGNYAASGGYYIGASADYIISEPTTLTGSIGAFSMLPNFYRASKEHLGINWDTISTGKRTFIYSSFIEKSAKDRSILQAATDQVYDQFKQIVADGRSMNIEEVEAIAQGRVWTGEDALDIGLVDALGGLDDAITKAAEMAAYGDYRIKTFPRLKKTFWEELIGNVGSNVQSELQPESTLFNEWHQQLNKAFSILSEACQEPQLRMPLELIVN